MKMKGFQHYVLSKYYIKDLCSTKYTININQRTESQSCSSKGHRDTYISSGFNKLSVAAKIVSPFHFKHPRQKGLSESYIFYFSTQKNSLYNEMEGQPSLRCFTLVKMFCFSSMNTSTGNQKHQTFNLRCAGSPLSLALS